MRYLILLLVVIAVSCGDKKTTQSNEPAAQIEYETKYDSINDLLKQEPNNPAFYDYRSSLRVKDKEYELALGDLNRAIALDSLNDKWYIRKADLLFDLERFKESKDVLDNAIFKAPGSIPIMLSKSEMYLITGDLQNCITWANAALSFDVYNAQAYFLKGMAHKYERDTVKAVTSFQTAVEQDMNHYEAYMQLANLYALELHELAPSYYNNAIRIDSVSIEAFYGRGLYYQNTNQPDKAIADYQKILELDSNYAEAYYNMGYVKLLLLEQKDTAEVLFNKAFSVRANYFDALYMLGYAMELNGRPKDAAKTYRKVLEEVPDHLLAAKGLNRVM